MNNENNAKNIIFDYDGTFHNSMKIYGKAFRKAYKYLVYKGYAKDKTFDDFEIEKWLGYSSKDMWNNFMPNLCDEEKEKCSNIIGTSMLYDIECGKAELYDGSLEVLKALKNKGFNLIFLSNCKIKYMEANKKAFNLMDYFDDFYCSESFDFIPKYEIFNFIKKKYSGEFIVVGDRYLDIEIAKIHKLYSIGCAYGFSKDDELDEADIIVQNVMDIEKYI